MNMERCQQLLMMLWNVGKAFETLEENAERLAKGEEVLCDLSPDGPLGLLAQQTEKVADDANAMFKSWVNPLTLKPVDTDLCAPHPLLMFSKAVETLRELVQWDGNKSRELERTIAWLHPQGVIVFGDVGCYNRDGTLSRSNTAWKLAFECRCSRSVLDKWIERTEAEGARLACTDAQQALAKTEKERDDAVAEAKTIRKMEADLHYLAERERKREKNARSSYRKQGGQKQDDDKAINALRKQLLALDKDPRTKGWTQKKLIEEAMKTVNLTKFRLQCKWESYRPLLPPSRRRSEKKK
jgi:hypothetical protein